MQLHSNQYPSNCIDPTNTEALISIDPTYISVDESIDEEIPNAFAGIGFDDDPESDEFPSSFHRTGDIGQTLADPLRYHFLKTFEGSECVYRERGIISLARLIHVDFTDAGITFDLELIPSEGFRNPRKNLFPDFPRFQLSASWEAAHITKRSVSASWVNWHLYIDPDLVDQAKRLALTTADLPHQKALDQFTRVLRGCLPN